MSLLDKWGFPIIDESGYRRLDAAAGSHQDALELLQVRLAQDYLNIWATLPPGLSDEQTFRYLRDALTDLQLAHGTDAAALAAEFLAHQRQGMDLPTVVAPPAGSKQVGGAVGWALSNDQAQALLWGAMQRMMMQPYRETIRDSAFAAGNGFARVPEPGACDFCLMLASRGAVYSNADEAKHVFTNRADRGNQKKGDPYHDNCNCGIIEVNARSGLSESNIYLERLWGETFYNDPDDRTSPKNKHQSPEWMRAKWKQVLKEANLPWLSNRQIRR